MNTTNLNRHIREEDAPLAAALTPRGRGAIGTIQFRGDCQRIDGVNPNLFRAANRKPLSDQPIGNIVYGLWGERVGEEVVACRTDEHTVEIHCHGGDAAVERILSDLEAIGCRVSHWKEMVEAVAGTLEAEFQDALSRATTFRTASLLLVQQSGVLAEAVNELLAMVDAHPRHEKLLAALDEMLERGQFGMHLVRPWSVVLAGRPNVGKSSLVNALAGFTRSIVFDVPGTTRDVVTLETAFDGWPVELADTAGLRDEAERLESAGIELARRRLSEADCRLVLIDASRPAEESDRRLIATWPDAVLVAHKIDLPRAWNDEFPGGTISCSSLTGEGIDTVAAAIVRRLVPELPAPDMPIPFTPRQLALLERAHTAIEQNDIANFRDALGTFLR